MSIDRTEELSSDEARVRLRRLGARLQKEHSHGRQHLYWVPSDGSWLWVSPTKRGTYRLQRQEGCGC